VVSLAEASARRRRPVLGIGLAIAAGVIITVGFVQRETIQAWFSPGPAPTQSPLVPPTSEETPQEKAAKLREAAYVNVAKGYYGEAHDQLDAAKLLDPAGDESPRAKAAWGQILGHKRDHTGNSKPPLGPGERPLPKPKTP
jgi:hypothetical protein